MRVGKYAIDQILFEKGFSKGCGPFACESTCCESGVYVDLKEKLVQRGVTADEIAFIHEAKSDEQRAKMFLEVNTGKIRVLIGSTEKMGTGMNVQSKLLASAVIV